VKSGGPRAKPFAALMESVPGARVQGDGAVEVVGFTQDSRQVAPGYAFICVRGSHDGHSFLPEALSRGAVAVVVEAGRERELPPLPAVGIVSDTRAALAAVARAFYDDPCSQLILAGVTGTNGKTTTTLMADAIFRAAGWATGVVGTVEYRVRDRRIPAPHTTPEADGLQRLFAEMVEEGVTHVAMEVSSHALALHRVEGCQFEAAVFTNLTPEHLDFHPDMQHYFDTKLQLFADEQYLPEGRERVNAINVDDEVGREVAERAKGRTLTYGITSLADCRAEGVQLGAQSTRFTAVLPAGRAEIAMQPLGRFNVYNALAALTVCTGMGIPLETAVAGIAGMPPVRGRFERVAAQTRNVLVDYAHTPDGLEKALQSARELSRGRVIVVFGCGGNRDRTKRPVMGELASRLAEECVITSDNPRKEDPQAIITEILGGIPAARRGECVVESDRAAAIRLAVEMARPDDLVLIAGKGHEDYQIIGEMKRHFDDREVAEQVIAELEGRDG
jgi:UDP-N-acetylmuramoyl-L-alanyl-D-glutamate--2,6-diaminopimelate ligase